jgi:hypothetical protein
MHCLNEVQLQAVWLKLGSYRCPKVVANHTVEGADEYAIRSQPQALSV